MPAGAPSVRDHGRLETRHVRRRPPLSYPEVRGGKLIRGCVFLLVLSLVEDSVVKVGLALVGFLDLFLF